MSPTSTAWQQTSGAINKAISQTALLFYGYVNVAARVELAESFPAAQTCASPKDPTIEVHCRTRRGLQSQVTGVVSAHPHRLVFLAIATAYRIVLSPIDANQSGYCKVLTWSFVSKDAEPFLSTAEVYPQQITGSTTQFKALAWRRCRQSCSIT
ncbi:hypothetical protein SPRG_02791 [Saprolegnia parasitica CBS 223.65]|uniref:Uncharacterized protein n=1 Tax=Saprolegnia parasitica (strain CBS 223.65) TaxID=695850 RepID=A0A067CZT8_SAPPC|nr:hypothetical protein SPRG_02791 [Saprolegnia parasitica CBS 223.65]KDO32312.1 hypothetical protein SPRG_02791 [Saprolegnia parasitica CBS 223.65]|eukprot:XP_012196768.1 hypothetical protein SPRG_02791 [Saprolegnia parasitica CBS 223.65]